MLEPEDGPEPHTPEELAAEAVGHADPDTEGMTDAELSEQVDELDGEAEEADDGG